MESVVCIMMLVLVPPSYSLVDTDPDYCNVDVTRCNADGIYKYKWATAYQDWLLRDRLDTDLETVLTEPQLALQRSQKTLEIYPNRKGNI